MSKTFYKQVITEFNLFNKHNHNLLNKHQFVMYSPDRSGTNLNFGLLLPSMCKETSVALEPYVQLHVSGDDDSINTVDDLHVLLLEYLDQTLSITSAYQQNLILVEENAKRDTVENLFYIYQWYANMREKLLGTELYDLPLELDDRCSNMSINALKEVANQGMADPKLVDTFNKQGTFVTTFFGNIFPLVVPNKNTEFDSILNAFMSSNFQVPKPNEYKRNGLANVEFNNVLENAK